MITCQEELVGIRIMNVVFIFQRTKQNHMMWWISLPCPFLLYELKPIAWLSDESENHSMYIISLNTKPIVIKVTRRLEGWYLSQKLERVTSRGAKIPGPYIIRMLTRFSPCRYSRTVPLHEYNQGKETCLCFLLRWNHPQNHNLPETSKFTYIC